MSFYNLLATLKKTKYLLHKTKKKQLKQIFLKVPNKAHQINFIHFSILDCYSS